MQRHNKLSQGLAAKRLAFAVLPRGILLTYCAVSTCFLILSLCACGATSSSNAAATTQAEPSTALTEPTTTEAAAAAQATTQSAEQAATEEKPEVSSQQTAPTAAATKVSLPRVPRVGLSVQYIDATEIGAHDDVSETIDGGKFKGGVTYYWRAKNGTNDIVYSAIVVSGKVAQVSKWKTAFDYWYQEGSTLTSEVPNLYAAGQKITDTTQAPTLYDPSDYDSPEDFADDNEAYFAAQGKESPWDYAYSYWERYVG